MSLQLLSGKASRSRRSLGLFILLLVLVAPKGSARAETPDPKNKDAKDRPAADGARVGATKRRLLVLPFENESGDAALDYLKRGLPRMLANRLRNFGYIYTPRGSARFRLNPRGAPGSVDETQGVRLPLEVEVISYDASNYRDLKIYGAERFARARDVDFLIEGRLNKTAGSDEILAELNVLEAAEGKRVTLTFALNPRDAYGAIDEPAQKVFSLISLADPVDVNVDTETPGAMAYLDELYLGRTPAAGRLVPGVYTLRLIQAGREPYNTKVTVRPGRINAFQVDPPKNAHHAGLSVKSEPSGADVYLNAEHIGKTPLERRDLPPGTHRVRIHLEKHVDRHLGVKLENGKTASLDAALSPGDTRRYYRDPGYVVLDWTFYDLSFYSLLSSLGFYGGWAHFNVRADTVASSIREQTSLLAAAWELSSATTLLTSITPYELYIYDRNTRRVSALRRRADVSAGLGVVQVLAAGLFLYLGLKGDEVETGELGFTFRPELELAPAAAGESTRDGAGTRFSFALRARF